MNHMSQELQRLDRMQRHAAAELGDLNTRLGRRAAPSRSSWPT